jgi:hypothetical protein
MLQRAAHDWRYPLLFVEGWDDSKDFIWFQRHSPPQ